MEVDPWVAAVAGVASEGARLADREAPVEVGVGAVVATPLMPETHIDLDDTQVDAVALAVGRAVQHIVETDLDIGVVDTADPIPEGETTCTSLQIFL